MNEITAGQDRGKVFVQAVVLPLLPIVVMILMTKPALRQKILMSAALAGRNFAIWQASFWQEASFAMARVYDKVRL